MSNSILKESALAKLEKLGLTKEAVLSLVDDGEETIVAEDGDSGESKSWQQLVMEEHLIYYNKRYHTNHTFDEYYEGVTSDKIEVHYKWKEMLGLEEMKKSKPNENVNIDKFKKFGNYNEEF